MYKALLGPARLKTEENKVLSLHTWWEQGTYKGSQKGKSPNFGNLKRDWPVPPKKIVQKWRKGYSPFLGCRRSVLDFSFIYPTLQNLSVITL